MKKSFARLAALAAFAALPFAASAEKLTVAATQIGRAHV